MDAGPACCDEADLPGLSRARGGIRNEPRPGGCWCGPAYDAGSLAESWRFDVGTPAYGRPHNTDTTGAFPRPADSGRQATAEVMRQALADATR